jgi:hypothetical protein
MDATHPYAQALGFSEAMTADLAIPFGPGKDQSPLLPVLAALRAEVAALEPERFAAFTPLLAGAVEPNLRQAITVRFNAHPTAAVAVLLAEAEAERPAPGPHLASGVQALTYVLQNFATYGAAQSALRAAFAGERPRLKAVAQKLGKGFAQDQLAGGIAALGFDDDDLAKIKKLLDTDKASAFTRLRGSALRVDPRAGELVAPLQGWLRRHAGAGSRDHGTGLFLLSELALRFEVDAELFIQAAREFPKSNELEYATTGLKRLGQRLAATQQREKLEALKRAVAGLSAPLSEALEKLAV